MNSRTTNSGHTEKSDTVIVPRKSANKPMNVGAESMEGRTVTKRNTHANVGGRTQSRANATYRLMGVREAARRDKRTKFTALFHHVTIQLLRESFYQLKRFSAPGVDGQSWKTYEQRLGENLRELHESLHRGSYRPKPARRTTIPKADGSERPISVQSVRDKVAQMAVVKILEQIYEEQFLGFSYGFRPGRSQHDALDALTVGLKSKKVNWVLDLDIRKYFDSVGQDRLLKIIQHRVRDRRILRLLRQWLEVGYIDAQGRRIRSQVGAAQGAVVSPLLANVYLHYALDQWSVWWRKHNSKGDMIIVRYADDVIVGFQHHEDAQRFQKELVERLRDFGLEINEQKSRLIRFGRYAEQQQKERGLGKPPTFDFLGFTHYCGRSSNGGFAVRRRSVRKRVTRKLKEIRLELKRRRHAPVSQHIVWLSSVIQGHCNYYGVPGNLRNLTRFRYELLRAWYRALCRRSQKKRINWQKFGQFLGNRLPSVHTVHPYPEERFYAKYSR